MLVGARDASRDRWVENTNVKRIVDAILRTGEPRLVLWAREATLADNRKLVEDEFHTASDPEVLKAAHQISKAGAGILSQSPGDRTALIGAIVERLARDLVAAGGRNVDTERRVGLVGSARSNPLDIVVDADPFEAYECKYSPDWVNQEDLNALAAVRDAAVREGREGIVGLVTIDSWRAVEAAVAQLTIPGDIRHSCASDILELRDGPAQRRLARRMGAGHIGL